MPSLVHVLALSSYFYDLLNLVAVKLLLNFGKFWHSHYNLGDLAKDLALGDSPQMFIKSVQHWDNPKIMLLKGSKHSGKFYK